MNCKVKSEMSINPLTIYGLEKPNMCMMFLLKSRQLSLLIDLVILRLEILCLDKWSHATMHIFILVLKNKIVLVCCVVMRQPHGLNSSLKYSPRLSVAILGFTSCYFLSYVLLNI